MKLGKSFLFLAAFLFAMPAFLLADATSPTTQPDHLNLFVIDAATGQPLTAAAATIYSSAADDQKLSAGSDGRLSVPLPHQTGFGYFEISVHAKGYAGKGLQWEATDKDPIPAQYTLKMDLAVKIGGRITNDAGKPVAGAHIVLWMGRQKSDNPHERYNIDADDILSAADGSWTFAEAPPTFQAIEMGCWHYDYANGDSFPMKSLSPAQLHSGSETYVLPRGIPITGTIQDATGRPLAGSEVLTGAQMCSNRVPAQKTDAIGRFHYFAKPGDEVTLTITREGYAPELTQYLMGNDPHDITIRLSKSKPMIGRVIGPKGEPVPFAWVYPDTWRGNRSLEIQIRADATGKFEWKDAPLDTVYCDVDATDKGYIRNTHIPLTASEHEITVTLRRALSVNGTVVDAQTNAPVDNFTAVHGISFGPEQPTVWQRNAQNETNGHAGKFAYHITWTYPGYGVRIEAPGYQPAESRVFSADEGEVFLDFKLNKGVDIMGKILKPDGQPAADATLVLALAGQTAYLYNGREVRDQGCQKSTTAVDGTFRFPPQSGPFELVVFDDEGYAEVDQDALSKSSTIKLQPWAKIDGSLKVAGKLAPDEQIAVMPKGTPNQPDKPRVHHQINAKTDADGAFAFDRVPPGQGLSVAREVMQPTGGGSFMGFYTETKKIDLSPGQSLHVDLGGIGRPIEGRVVIPQELSSRQDWVFGVSCRIFTEIDRPTLPDPPADVKNGTVAQRQAWMANFLKSDAGKALIAAQNKAAENMRSYPLQISQDGAWHADDVDAGTYTVTVDIARKNPDSTCGTGESIAVGSAQFTVPRMPQGFSDQPLTIPSITLQMQKNIGVGDAAPDFSVKTLDGKTLTLSKLRGQYVLLDYWATWCGPCIAELPNIKAAYDAYGKDPRFVMISISLDEKADDAKTYADKNATLWNQEHGKPPSSWPTASNPSPLFG
jgi:thiol-disulfide isomerase/thioredoxin